MEFSDPSPALPDAAYFAAPEPYRHDGLDGEWFQPSDYARGPWSPDALHGGPVAAVLSRALERSFPTVRLMRITVDLVRPVPMAGFAIVAEVIRPGRLIAATRATLYSGGGTVCAIANGMHLANADEPVIESSADNSGAVLPRLADSHPGPFVSVAADDGLTRFGHSVTMRYPAGETPDPGPTRFWMRSLPIIDGEQPSPFQRICPLSDCGNAFSRHANPHAGGLGFINPDLTIALHRDPLGDWAGMHSTSQWQPQGVGLVTSQIFDDLGLIGTAMQTLLLRPV